jgi:hypothetical protein
VKSHTKCKGRAFVRSFQRSVINVLNAEPAEALSERMYRVQDCLHTLH